MSARTFLAVIEPVLWLIIIVVVGLTTTGGGHGIYVPLVASGLLVLIVPWAAWCLYRDRIPRPLIHVLFVFDLAMPLALVWEMLMTDRRRDLGAPAGWLVMTGAFVFATWIVWQIPVWRIHLGAGERGRATG